MLPEHFNVGAAVRSSHGGGRLCVAPGGVVLKLGPVTRRATGVVSVTHRSRDITMLTARLLPPFLNTHLIIEDDDVVAVASMPGWFRRRLRSALDEAGLRLDEQPSWFASGLDRVKPWP